MIRNNLRRRLALAWWWQLVVTLAPLLAASALFGSSKTMSLVLAMPLFIAGLLSMFVSLKPFGAYKRALISTEAALDTPEEAAVWRQLAAVRGKAFLAAGLPAWIAAAAVFVGLEAVPLVLLAISSVVLLYLYRIPRQLG
ncbi:MFS transporter [Pseudomonas sp. DSP3-2-2]|uniref:MFS transporter n=1 Tax=unclassified Pseudomonas TaxID=196821 RepID=UPI003CE8B13C